MSRQRLTFALFLMVTLLLLPIQNNVKAKGDDGGENSGKGPFIGAWYGKFYGVSTAMTLHADGTFASSSSDSLGQAGLLKTPISGGWVKTGPRSFKLKGFIFTYDLAGKATSVVQLNTLGEVSKDGMRMSLLSTPEVYFCIAFDDCPNPITDTPDFVYPEPIPIEWDRIVP